MRKIGWVRMLLVTMAGATLWSAQARAATTIKSIGFDDDGKSSKLEIKADGPISFEKQVNAKDKQIVIDLKGASLTPQTSRILDTSQFNSRVNLVSPYSVDGGARLVIQLREMAAAEVSQDGNSITVKVPSPSADGEGGAEEASAAPPPTTDEAPNAAASEEEHASSNDNDDSANRDTEVKVNRPSTNRQARRASHDLLDDFLQARETRRFIGKPITLQVRNADLVDVFRLIGETSGFNIVIGDGVSGNITLSLTDVPWDQALDVILRTKRLGAERSNNLLRIVTLANLTSEKQDELKAKLAAESNAPRIVRIFPISYAKISDIQALLSKFATSQPAAAAQAGVSPSGAATSPQPIVSADERTNSLIVRDTPENIERVRKLIEVLDTQTPQILIEGKVVEANEQFSRAIKGNFGLAGNAFNGPNTNLSNPNFGATFAGSDIKNSFQLPTSSGTAGGTNGALGISPYAGFIPGLSRINATISLAEVENKVKIISSPRTVVLNKESATITQSTPVAIPTTSTTGSTIQTTFSFQQANLTLAVVPTVTNDSGVLMQINLSRDAPQNGGVSTRSVNTKVIVPSGNTLVIGGIYTAQSEVDQDGFPILRKIPILGAFFGSDSVINNKAELLFFITPRILNSTSAGLGS